MKMLQGCFLAMFILLKLLGTGHGFRDVTREDRGRGTEVVEAVVDLIQSSCIFPNDNMLLRRIAWVETKDGTRNDSFTPRHGHPHLGGIWQVTKSAFKDTKSDPNLASLRSAVEEHFLVNWTSLSWRDLGTPLYSGLAARLRLAQHSRDLPRDLEGQAMYWNTHYRAGARSRKKHFIRAVQELLNNTRCQLPRADVVFVLDSSGSVGFSNFRLVLQFLTSVIEGLDIGEDKFRVGVIQYARFSQTEIRLGEHNTKASLLDHIREIRYLGGPTRTDYGLVGLEQLHKTQSTLREKNGETIKSPKIGVVITDGKSTEPQWTLRAARILHDSDITMLAIGISNATEQKELEAIGSCPSCLHVFNLDDFGEVTSLRDEIEMRTCKASLGVTANISGKLEYGQVQYLRFNVPTDNLTLVVTMTSGSASLYSSWAARYPSPSIYDYQLHCDTQLPHFKMHVPYPANASTPNVPLYSAIYGTSLNSTSDNCFQLTAHPGKALTVELNDSDVEEILVIFKEDGHDSEVTRLLMILGVQAGVYLILAASCYVCMVKGSDLCK
ncbi:collagen alpha-1(VII) chain [Lingula anatina]|uniref:Collagen alpha-1(VII) chain n=1 Tax=Lingula anatina TaxID=7574 RepID=A0A1S3HGI2_LINAN|nr:collagen alpha-1(VII) chain [Lingula anatina]XP_013385193.1 collagen alpha-1(VII) chain [Lingula anatina]|eukprot:XP_013385192.1 collagen alpha-1(VII) chain [Lingula anatina]